MTELALTSHFLVHVRYFIRHRMFERKSAAVKLLKVNKFLFKICQRNYCRASE